MHNLMSQETSATRQQLGTSGMDLATWFLCHVENALNQFTNLIQGPESHRTTNLLLQTSAMTHRKAYPGQGVCVNTLIKTLIAPYAAPGSCVSVKGNGVLQHGKARTEGKTKLLQLPMPPLPLLHATAFFKSSKAGNSTNYTTWECIPKEALLETKQCWYTWNQNMRLKTTLSKVAQVINHTSLSYLSCVVAHQTC